MRIIFKKVLCVIVAIVFCITIIGCADSKVINGKEVEPYGLINKNQVKQDNVHYRVCNESIIWGIILFETIVMPIYFFGFSLYEPVSAISNETNKK